MIKGELLDMVYTYTGTPGSGKSLHCAESILFHLKHGYKVICNFPINTNMIKKKYRNNFYYIPDSELTPHYLFEFAKAFHKKAKEDQTWLFIDEAQRLFPIDRVYTLRREWEQFFQLHRHYGFAIVIVTQNMSYINKGIRIQTEYEVKHRKINNYGIGGLILTLLHIPLFVAITYWQGTREKIYSDFFLFKRRYGKLYDTFSNFDTDYIDSDRNELDKPLDQEDEDQQIRAIENMTREEQLNIVFGEPDEEEYEEIDQDSADFDEENIESWGDDLYISEADLQKWKTA